MVLVRQEIGDVLRDFRLQKGRTLRQVASKASVALGYLSEVERGQKEASSEILASVADALDTPISIIMREVSDRLAVVEGLTIVPDTVPVEMVADFDAVSAALVARARPGDLVLTLGAGDVTRIGPLVLGLLEQRGAGGHAGGGAGDATAEGTDGAAAR